MLKWRPFDYQSLQQLEADIVKAGVDLPISEDFSVFKEPMELYGHSLKNRLSIQPLEGFDAGEDGTPSDLTFRRYRRFSAGGAGLLWFESCAVTPTSQTSRNQCRITEDNLPVFQRLVDEIKTCAKDGKPPFTIVQLTHCGRNSRLDGDGTFGDKGIPQYVACDNPYLPKPKVHILSDEELEKISDDYVKAAALMKRAGFDAVDIRGCHGYLMSELLSSFTRENSKYGGPLFENRTRLLLETIDRVKEEVNIPIAIRLNACDMIPYPYGWGMAKDGSLTPDLEEPLKLGKLLVDRGVKLLNISMGRNHATHLQLPYNRGSHYPKEHQLYAMEFYHSLAATFKKEIPQATVMTGTLSWPGIYAANIAAGEMKAGMYDLPGFGRLPWAYPDFANDILEEGGLKKEKCCIACNSCCNMIGVAAPTGCPVGCPIRDREIYGPLYKKYVGDTVRQMQPKIVELFDLKAKM